MISTDPAGFDSEATGAFKVQPLGEAFTAADPEIVTVPNSTVTYHLIDETTPEQSCTCGMPELPNVVHRSGPGVLCYRSDDLSEQHGGYTPSRILMDPSLTHPPVSLVYAHSDGKTFTRVDMDNPLTNPSGDDDVHRERLLLRALLTHTLATLDGEDVS